MSDRPHNWVEVTDRRPVGPVAIFDMDGVLSDATHRQDFLRRDPPDWDGFGAVAHLDTPLAEGRDAIDEWRPDHVAVVVTARPIAMHGVTIAWLAEHDFSVDLVVFRPDGDLRPSPEMKRDELARIQAFGGDVRVAYEDERRNLDMYRAAGIETVYVHSGYYDLGTAEH